MEVQLDARRHHSAEGRRTAEEVRQPGSTALCGGVHGRIVLRTSPRRDAEKLRTHALQARLCSVSCFGQWFSSRTIRKVGKHGGSTREVLQRLWAGVTSGRPILLQLRRTGSPLGARTHTGGRCSCSPAPTRPKHRTAAASGRSVEYSGRSTACPTLRASAMEHQGDSGSGSGRGRVHAPNVTVGETSRDSVLRGTCPHDGGRGLVHHQSVP